MFLSPSESSSPILQDWLANKGQRPVCVHPTPYPSAGLQLNVLPHALYLGADHWTQDLMFL